MLCFLLPLLLPAFPSPTLAASVLFLRCCYLPLFIPGTRFSPLILTEPINLSALISMLLCSPGVRGFLQSCSGDGSAGDTSSTSAPVPQLWWSTRATSAPFVCPGAQAGLPAVHRQISGLQSILCLIPVNAIDLTLLLISMLHPEIWSPSHPCSKLLPRNSPHRPGSQCQGRAAGDLWVTAVRQVGPVDRQADITALYSLGEANRSSHAALVPTSVFLPPSCSVLPCDSQDRQMALLSGSWGLNSTCLHLGAEWECVAWGKSHCVGHFCLCNDLYRGLARALLGARGFCGGGINPHRGRKGRRGTFNLLQLFCICHTPFKPRLGFYMQCTGFQW